MTKAQQVSKASNIIRPKVANSYVDRLNQDSKVKKRSRSANPLSYASSKQLLSIKEQQAESVKAHQRRLTRARQVKEEEQVAQENRPGGGRNWNASLTVPETPRIIGM